MGEFLQLILNSIEYLWVFRIIHQWEHGAYYIRGRYWKTFGPGVYFVVPFFTTLIDISTAPHMLITPRLDLTLSDGTPVSLTVSAWVRVLDPANAINSVDNWWHTTRELVKAVIAEKVAEIDADRLAPNKRTRLLTELSKSVNAESGEYGVEVTKIRFSTLVLKARTYRLLSDAGVEYS